MEPAYVAVVSVGLVIFSCHAVHSEEVTDRAEAQEEAKPPMIRLGETRAPLGVAFGANGGKIVTCSRSESVGVWSSAAGHRILGIPNPTDGLFSARIVMSGDGRRIVTGGPAAYEEQGDLLRVHSTRRGSLVRLWDAESGRLIRTFLQGERHYFNQVAVDRTATHIACVDYRLNSVLWDGSDGKVISMVDGPAASHVSSGPSSTSFSADATRFVAVAVNIDDEPWHSTAGRDTRFLYLCDLSGRHVLTIPPLPENGGGYGALALSGDGKEIAVWFHGTPGGFSTVRAGQQLVTYDFETGKIKAKISMPNVDAPNFIAYSPDRSTIALGDSVGKVILIDRVGGLKIAEVVSGTGPVRAIAFRNGSIIVVSDASVSHASNELRSEKRDGSLEVREHVIPLLHP